MFTRKAQQPGYAQGVASMDDLEVLTGRDLRQRLLDVFRDPRYVPPVLPKVAMDLLALSRRPDVNVRDIIALLESDALIAAKVLRQAQSAAYSRGTPVRSLHEAVVRLGLGTVRDLFLAATMEARVFRAPGYDETMDRIRRHSTAAAHVARLVCRHTSIDEEYGFLCGLLHDSGIAASLIAMASNLPRGKNPPELSLVWDAICDTHEEVGGYLCRLWKLPLDVCYVAGGHHSARAGQPTHPLAAAVAVTESVLLEIELALPGDGSEASERWAFDALRLPDGVLASIVSDARDLLSNEDEGVGASSQSRTRHGEARSGTCPAGSSTCASARRDELSGTGRVP